MWSVFFNFLMLNISSIKELSHKPLEIQWNKILQGKLKREISCALSYKILPPEILKTWEIAILGVLWRPGNQYGILWFFMILWRSESSSFYLLVKNSFNFKLGFFTYFEYISWGIIRKNILSSDYHSARWYWCKKDHIFVLTYFTWHITSHYFTKTLQTSHYIFSQYFFVNF